MITKIKRGCNSKNKPMDSPMDLSWVKRGD